jgi:MYXO-CTERM domain-containing protein
VTGTTAPYEPPAAHRRSRPWALAARIALALVTIAVLGLGVIVWGRVADTPTAARVLTGAWFAVAAVVALLLIRRRRGLAVPLIAGYLVAAIGTALLVALPTVRDRTVDEADVIAVADNPTAGPTGPQPTALQPTGSTPAAAPTTTAPAAPPAPVEIGRAELAGIDHTATGTARLIRLADGSLLVRLQDIDIQPGPDYYVHLVRGAGQREPAGGSQLARLKGNRGSQNYPVPRGRSAETPVTVLIWCRAFDTPVANATIR